MFEDAGESPAGDGERRDVETTRASLDATRSTAAAARGRGVPETIGRYRIIRLVAQGGMGAVYEAEQDKPHRRVALKLIKAGYADPELLSRFERESQALGRLHHPGIAQIFDAGTAETPFGSQPYFAMELIEGLDLVTYAREHHLTTRQRLELLARVCDAVHHAHQRGLIHRDLKPGNVLVDAAGQPKILDFGIAKITDSDAQATRQTDIGQLMGTLPYMSPEQVTADPFEIDTRSDVYALGVILYELLAGKRPYEVANRSLPEAVQVIREQEATRLSSCDRAYRGDIDTIVAKALEKDKGRRYNSAADMAADVRRFLNDEPITARPASTAYQVRKFARRHRALVASVAAVLVVLVAGIIVSSVESVRARHAELAARQAEAQARSERDRALSADATATHERDRAVQAETQANRERDTALAEKRRADTAAATATAINNFLQNDLLAQASAEGQEKGSKLDPDIKVRTVLDRAAGRIGDRFKDRPQVEASIEATIGTTYYRLGLYDKAIDLLSRAEELDRRSLGPDNAATLSVAGRLGDVFRTAGKYKEAEPLLRATIDAARRSLGPDNPATLEAMQSLAQTYVEDSKYAQAEPVLAEVIARSRRALGRDNRVTLDSMGTLARVYFVQHKLPEAAQVLIEMIGAQKRQFGPDSPVTLLTMNNLAVLDQQAHRYSEAEALYNDVIERQRRTLGPDHPDTLNSLNNLAVLYAVEGKYTQAEPLYDHVLQQWTKQLGAEHPRTLSVMANIAMLMLDEGKLAAAEAEAKKVLDIRARVLGPEHTLTLESMKILGAIYEAEGKYDLAEPLDRKLLDARRRVLGATHPATLDTAADLGEVLVDEGKYTQAESVLRDALAIEQKARPDSYRGYWMENLLGAALAGEKNFADAEPLLVSGYEGMQKVADSVDALRRQKIPKAGEQVVRLYTAWEQPQKLQSWKARLAKK